MAVGQISLRIFRFSLVSIIPPMFHSQFHLYVVITRMINELSPEIFQKKNCGVKVKGKAIPLQAWTGPEGSSRLRLPDSKTIGT